MKNNSLSNNRLIKPFAKLQLSVEYMFLLAIIQLFIIL